MIKAILFDFDGVLTVDATGSQSICNYVSKITGVDKTLFTKEYKKFNKVLLNGSIKHEDIWEKICEAINFQISIEVLFDSFINTPMDIEMCKLVKKLKGNNYIIGMVTHNKKDRIDAIRDYHRFNNLFDEITVSAEVGSGKEDKEIFLRTVKKLGVKANECVFIDNTEKNLIVPNEMGMETIFYDHTERNIDKLLSQLKALGIKL
ncbi:putative hydrolase of the HAD superfamily [Clostridium punense]|uniref:Hydrolase of the HAD superfamily n=1 Tax=Clostridium punense TaxID=1054297 RepID=A0ABS4K8Q9_9CLOT|nr:MULTISPECIES: HAD-IA family hydrolase [Clostridium]EQB89995.1 hypothetical protein M918_02310 [Clostridium sp. BL8]MBP2024167.1 putative hydrolase of the HAD superfamily [Clostridium punense]